MNDPTLSIAVGCNNGKSIMKIDVLQYFLLERVNLQLPKNPSPPSMETPDPPFMTPRKGPHFTGGSYIAVMAMYPLPKIAHVT